MAVMGRPRRLSDGERRAARIRLILTELELRYIERYAKDAKRSPATWCRELVLGEVRRQMGSDSRRKAS